MLFLVAVAFGIWLGIQVVAALSTELPRMSVDTSDRRPPIRPTKPQGGAK